MSGRTLALAMNTVERVAELYVGDKRRLPSSQTCPEVMQTYLDALEHFFEGLVRYGTIVVPKLAWRGSSRAKCEEFTDHLKRLGLCNCITPMDLRQNKDYRSLAIGSLAEAGEMRALQPLLCPNAANERKHVWGPWREFVYRESLQFECPLRTDVREIWPDHYVTDEVCALLLPHIPGELVVHLARYLERTGCVGSETHAEQWHNAVKKRVGIYVVSSLVRAREGGLIYRDANADYFPFLLHAPLEEMDSIGLHAPVAGGSFAKKSRIVHAFVQSFLTDIIDRVPEDPDDIWRRLANLLADPKMQALRKELQRIAGDMGALADFEDALEIGDYVVHPEYKDDLVHAASDAVDAIPLFGKVLKAAVSLCKVFVTYPRAKSISRRFGKFIHHHKRVKTSAVDLQSRFQTLFGDRFAQ